METCKTCAYWDDHAFQGQCRRHAPVAALRVVLKGDYLGDSDKSAWWPLTHERDWCGDYATKITVAPPQET